MAGWATYWAVDLHVHTPGSADAEPENYGSPADIVAAALGAGLDAIAITDHNTADWCDVVAAAAAGTDLIVLPGVEISTSEGHLLAIWEEGTKSSHINEVLAILGILEADRGKLDIAAGVGIADAAARVVADGGIAVAAHVDRPKGLLQQPVAAAIRRALLDSGLTAVEVFDLGTRATIDRKIDGMREMAYVQGSDTWSTTLSQHALSGIGRRRTWIKASRPDLVGIKHALADPSLRTRLNAAPPAPTYPRVERVELVGGFLNGQSIPLSPDLNCLLGGTGAGKSLILESVRYAVNQQVDGAAFPAIFEEVRARLKAALGNGLVRLEFRSGDARYLVERPLAVAGAAAQVFQHIGDGWVAIDANPEDLISIAAFSQGEVLEYSRQPVGRMSLVDAGIALSEVETRIAATKDELATNSTELIAARARVARLREASAQQGELSQQVRELAGLFDSDTVKQQESWNKEAAKLTKVEEAIGDIRVQPIAPPAAPGDHAVAENEDLFIATAKIVEGLKEEITEVQTRLGAAVAAAKTKLGIVTSNWSTRRADFDAKLDAELKKVDPASSLTALRTHLDSLQTKVARAKAAKDELTDEAHPALRALELRRNELLVELHDARKVRREKRRSRAAELNAKTAGFVKLDVPSEGDYAEFREALNLLKVGSRARETVLDAIAQYTHPFRFARALWEGNVNELVDDSKGIDASTVARLLANIDERDLWEDLLAAQLIDRPDVLTIRFRKPDDGMYTPIEDLAHGQRCTAILVILLAEGDTPVIVDQPEDALHAPWIEEYLVDRLRDLRGTRQYIFATRSPGIVVSGDAEQIITMRATAGHGEVEASGSLERHDLNKLALHHLEGGPVPFSRRRRKLQPSTE